MSNTPLNLRLPTELHDRTVKYAAQINKTHSEAIRRLIVRGLDVSATDSYDVAKTLARLSAAVQQAADRLGVLEADTAQMVALLPDMKTGVDSLQEWLEELHPHGKPLIKMLCEVLIVARLQMNASDPEVYKKLGAYTNGMFDGHMKTALAAGAAKGSITDGNDGSRDG